MIITQKYGRKKAEFLAVYSKNLWPVSYAVLLEAIAAYEDNPGNLLLILAVAYQAGKSDSMRAILGYLSYCCGLKTAAGIFLPAMEVRRQLRSTFQSVPLIEVGMAGYNFPVKKDFHDIPVSLFDDIFKSRKNRKLIQSLGALAADELTMRTPMDGRGDILLNDLLNLNPKLKIIGASATPYEWKNYSSALGKNFHMISMGEERIRSISPTYKGLLWALENGKITDIGEDCPYAEDGQLTQMGLRAIEILMTTQGNAVVAGNRLEELQMFEAATKSLGLHIETHIVHSRQRRGNEPLYTYFDAMREQPRRATIYFICNTFLAGLDLKAGKQYLSFIYENKTRNSDSSMEALTQRVMRAAGYGEFNCQLFCDKIVVNEHLKFEADNNYVSPIKMNKRITTGKRVTRTLTGEHTTLLATSLAVRIAVDGGQDLTRLIDPLVSSSASIEHKKGYSYTKVTPRKSFTGKIQKQYLSRDGKGLSGSIASGDITPIKLKQLRTTIKGKWETFKKVQAGDLSTLSLFMRRGSKNTEYITTSTHVMLVCDFSMIDRVLLPDGVDGLTDYGMLVELGNDKTLQVISSAVIKSTDTMKSLRRIK